MTFWCYAGAGLFMNFFPTTLLWVLCLGACVSPAPQTALSVASKASVELAAGDVVAASALLTDEARARGRKWPKLGESAALATELRRKATWSLNDNTEIRLVHGDGGWRIASGVLRFLDTSTPSNALHSFSRSILGGDYELMVRLLPAEDRKVWGPGQLMRKLVDEQVKQSWRSLAIVIERRDYALNCVQRVGECVVKTNTGETLLLRQEGKDWKVVDIQPYDKYIPKPSS